ncbi:serine-threonine protein kinase, putative [Bodo saltans]|uniref:Serine-threonine protein kinase, putative n=1 Tax=Bodo saltans TaxID=75058 RepID=A0A0S4IY61_BODSA|nr:serine-threonine protein kinase, putative [Bodo saltans]|eukprot:CUG51957.1 serine-threonine protein kinase, putative [Bodo saltans]
MTLVYAVTTLVALVCTTTALKTDSILWTTPLNNTNEIFSMAQWVATSPDGSSIIALSGANFVSLNATTGAELWAAQDNEYLSSLEVLAVSSTAVLAAVGTGLISFHLSNGSLIATASVPQGPNPFNTGISNIVVHGDLFVVYGGQNIAVMGSDLVMRYNVSVMDSYSLGVSSGFVYYTSGAAHLTIVDLITFEERRVDDVLYVSSAAANGNILVVQNSRPLVATIALSTGTFVWKNTDVVLNNVTTFVLIASTDVPLVVADNAVYAFDAVTGGLVFQYQTPFPTVSNPVVASGRLVYIGNTAQGLARGRLFVAGMDLSTGKSLGQVMTPTLLRPSLVVSGGHAMMINGQGYSLIDTLTMTAVSHNLNLQGQVLLPW